MTGQNQSSLVAAAAILVLPAGLASQAGAQETASPTGPQPRSNLTVDVRYHHTNEHDFGDMDGSRAVTSPKASF